MVSIPKPRPISFEEYLVQEERAAVRSEFHVQAKCYRLAPEW